MNRRIFCKSIIAACITMLAVEGWIFLFQSDDWDLQCYWQYSGYCRTTSWKDLYRDQTVEYPPLAVFFIVATDTIADRLPDLSRVGRYFEIYDQQGFANFKLLYRLEMFATVFAIFLLLCALLKRFKPDESDWERCERLAVFCLGIAMLSQIAFDRLDAVLGALLLMALTMMLSRLHYAWTFAALAVAIDFKFVPVVLGPLWVVGSLPVGMLASRKEAGGLRRILATVVFRSLLLGAMTGAFCCPFLLAAGGRCLAFLAYHKDRGIEFESTYAVLPGILKYAENLKTDAVLRFGGYDIESALSPALTRAAPLVAGALLVAVTLLLIINAARAVASPPLRDVPPGERLARAWPGGFVAHTMLVMLIFVFANKVFSPQYLLWLLPLAPLVPLSRRPRRIFHACFLGVCLLTALIYPYCVDYTLGRDLFGDNSTFTGPAPLGVLLLSIRALVMAALIAGLAAHLMRQKAGEVPR